MSSLWSHICLILLSCEGPCNILAMSWLCQERPAQYDCHISQVAILCLRWNYTQMQPYRIILYGDMPDMPAEGYYKPLMLWSSMFMACWMVIRNTNIMHGKIDDQNMTDRSGGLSVIEL